MAQTINITVVDDNISITQIISDYVFFANIDAEVTVFNDSREALKYIQSGKTIDILITDYQMPVVNGIELIEASSPDTRKVMISGFVSEIAEDKLVQIGADFLPKPISMKILGSLINEELEKRSR